MFVRFVVASMLSCTFAAAALADAAPPPKTPAPSSVSVDVKMGDRWDYQYHTTLNNRTSGTTSYAVQDVSAGKIDAERRLHDAGSGRDIVSDTVYDGSWRVLEAPGGRFLNADAASEPFASIAVGKQWTSDLLWQPKNSSLTFKWTEHGRVVAWESVTLPNGRTYDTFRIMVRRESTPPQGSGIQVVTPGLSTHQMVQRIVDWYAPAINRYIKRTFELSRDGTVVDSYDEELTNYARGDAE